MSSSNHHHNNKRRCPPSFDWITDQGNEAATAPRNIAVRHQRYSVEQFGPMSSQTSFFSVEASPEKNPNEGYSQLFNWNDELPQYDLEHQSATVEKGVEEAVDPRYLDHINENAIDVPPKRKKRRPEVISYYFVLIMCCSQISRIIPYINGSMIVTKCYKS